MINEEPASVGFYTSSGTQPVDPSARLSRLSTFMGHVDPASTAVYLNVTPELLTEANRRFEAFAAASWAEVR